MRITPLDVRKQEFRKVVRGLDADEVYAFLTTVADEYEACLSDNKQLREKVIDLDEKVSEYRNMETTLRDTLLTAERVMSEARQNARKEAELILRDATMKANGQTAHIAAEVEALKNQLRELRGHRDGFLARLQSLAESQVTLVESFRRDFQNEDAERSAQRTSNFASTETPSVAVDATQAVETVTAAFELEPQTTTAPPPDRPVPSSTPPETELATPVAAPAVVPEPNDQWRDYSVGASGGQAENRGVTEAPVVAVLDVPATETVTAPSVEVPTFAYENENEPTAGELAIEIAVEDSFSEPIAPLPTPPETDPVEEVAVPETEPAAPVVTEVDQLGVDPSEEDPIDRIARMMAEATAGQDSGDVMAEGLDFATGGQEGVAVATSVAPTEDEATTDEDSDEESRWSLSRFTKGLANF